MVVQAVEELVVQKIQEAAGVRVSPEESLQEAGVDSLAATELQNSLQQELGKEVKLLRQLSHCPYVAEVQAVFVQQDPYAAHVQMPYYGGGDFLAWLKVYGEVYAKMATLKFYQNYENGDPQILPKFRQ